MDSASIEAEYNEINSKNGWIGLFQSIREKCDREAKDKGFTLIQSRTKHNHRLNRYRDVNPYDHSRIILHRKDTDYINANLVTLERANRKYILTQGPLEITVGHFWLMIWEQNTKAILMLNKLIEKKQIKCHMYWPDKIGEEYLMNLTDVGLTVEYLKIEEFHHYDVRTFKLTDSESLKSREIIQFHYTTWPDFGIPSSPVAFLNFLKQVRESGALDPDVGPPVVHCSAGIGRSGTFCLVDCCLVLIENEGENKVSLQDVLLQLRSYRMGLIQTADQLLFSYQAIIDGIKRLNNPNFNDDYEEVPMITNDEEGEEIEETPPPLPPPRTDSLHGILPNNKPLPSIPNSESLHEDFITTTATTTNYNNKEIIKNLVNIEKSREINTIGGGCSSNINNINRPLPPLPKEISLESVNESDSDENGNLNDNGDDDDDDVDEEEEEDEIEESVSDVEVQNNEKDTISDKRKLLSDFNPEDSLPPTPLENNNASNGPIYDLDSPVSSPDSEFSPNSDVRRRKRQERATAMEDKIREIKRKQKMCEDKANSSPKKRRSLMISIAAGVVVIGVICVYAYTKLG